MNTTYIPISNQIDTSSVRQDILNIISPIMNKIAYIDSTILGDTTDGVFYFYFEVIDGVFLSIPLAGDLGVQIGKGFGEIGVSFFDNGNFEASLWLDIIQLQIPRKILIPAIQDTQGNTIPDENENNYVLIDFTLGLLVDGNLKFTPIYPGSISSTYSIPDSYIGNTGIRLSISNFKLDISNKDNIPEADLDGRSINFIGIFIGEADITLPDKFVPSSGANAAIKGKNLLIGTGGLSGTIGLELNTGLPSNTTPIIPISIGGFQLNINTFSLTFKQNAIIGSDVRATMTLPWFKNESGGDFVLDVLVHLEQNGEFYITAIPDQPISALIQENVFTLNITSFFVGSKNDRYFIGVSGDLSFENVDTTIGNFLSSAVSVKELIIWDDGKIEFKGGFNPLPKAVKLELGPAKISVTNIHLGQDQRTKNGQVLDYKFFGFDAALSLDPGGLDLRGDGIKLYYAIDNGNLVDIFMRIQGINIDLYIPGSVSRDKATVIIKGYLSLKNDPNGVEEYQGGIDFSMPNQGIAASAAMAYKPKVPSFLVDASLELATPIVLGATGLGIYGFRGIFGKRYVPSKTKIGLTEDTRWWEFYKKGYEGRGEGIYNAKYLGKDGTSVGAGISMATIPDQGYSFSSKLIGMFMPDSSVVIMGQAQMLKRRIGLDTSADPPFFASLEISTKHINAYISASMKLPSDGASAGRVATVNASAEAYFSFQDPSAWFLALGKPDNRVSVTLLGLFQSSFYMYISADGIEAAATTEFNVNKSFGPLKAFLNAYFDASGKMSTKPVQVGGAIKVGAAVGLKIFRFKFGLSAHAGLSMEAPNPFLIAGDIKVCVRVLRKDRCAHFSLTWNLDKNKQTSPINIIDSTNPTKHAKASQMLTGEQFNVAYATSTSDIGALAALGSGSWNKSASDVIIPQDSYIEIELLQSLNPLGSQNANRNHLSKLGGINMPANYRSAVPKRRGRTAPVIHEFYLDDFEIYYRDGNSWQPYNFYEAMQAAYSVDTETTTATALQNIKTGYWQTEALGQYKRLQILAQTPIQFLTKSKHSNLSPENFKINSKNIFCPPSPKLPDCVEFKFDSSTFNDFEQNRLYYYKRANLKLFKEDGEIKNTPLDNALYLKPGGISEFYFDGVPEVSITIKSPASNTTVKFYTRIEDGYDVNGIIKFREDLVHTAAVSANSQQTVKYDDSVKTDLIFRVVVTSGDIIPNQGLTCIDPTEEAVLMEAFLNELGSLSILDFGNYDINNPNEGHPEIVYTNSQYTPPYYINNQGSLAGLFDTFYLNTKLYPKQYNGSVVEFHCLYNDDNWAWFKITDNDGEECNIFLYDTLTGGVNVAYLQQLSQIESGPNYNGTDPKYYYFQVNAFAENTGISPFTQSGITVGNMTCFPVATCILDNETRIFDLCWLDEGKYIFNQTIIDNGTLDPLAIFKDQLSEPLSPVWRPNTDFAIKLKTRERVYSDNYDQVHDSFHYFGFRTAGPIGHFHKYLDKDDSGKVKNHPSFKALLPSPVGNSQTDKSDSYRLDELTDYIDFKNSYPDFKGKIATIKQRYFESPHFYLRFKSAYMHPLYQNWAGMGANTPVESKIEFKVIDPAQNVNQPVPYSQVEWVLKDAIVVPPDIQQMVNMMNTNSPCSVAELIVPKVKEPELVISNLEPQKLYTLSVQSVFAIYEGATKHEQTREVYRFVFETSRFMNFVEHINSISLIKDAQQNVMKSNSSTRLIQMVDAEFTSFINLMNTGSDPALNQNYPDKTDLILYGKIGVNDLKVEETMSATLFFREKLGKRYILGVLIQSPEPIYEIELDESEVLSKITLSIDGKITTANVEKYISKDFSKIFIGHNNSSISDSGNLTSPINIVANLSMTNIEYDGSAFVDGTTVSTTIIFKD